MGVYVYKISSKPCMTMDGRPVYEATYAYKPMGSEEMNKRLAFQAGVVSCEKYWDKMSVAERTNVLVLHGDRVYVVPRCTGAVYDDVAFDKEPYAVLDASITLARSKS